MAGDAEAADRDEATAERAAAWALAQESLGSLSRDDRADLANACSTCRKRVGAGDGNKT